MYPHERSLVRKLANKPFAIIGVNSDKDLPKTREVAIEKNITWRSFWNGEKGTRGPISTKWMVRGWPTTYLIDKTGVIRYKNLRGDGLDKAIETLMAEMDHEVELVGTDHEAEDKEAMSALKEEAKKAEAVKTEETEEVKTEAKSDDKKAEVKTTEAKKESAKPAKVQKVEVEKVEAKKVEAKATETATPKAETATPKAETATPKAEKTEAKAAEKTDDK